MTKRLTSMVEDKLRHSSRTVTAKPIHKVVYPLANWGLWPETNSALEIVAIVYIWQQAPLAALLFLAALQAIPQNLYNAAKVDGAGAVRRLMRFDRRGGGAALARGDA